MAKKSSASQKSTTPHLAMVLVGVILALFGWSGIASAMGLDYSMTDQRIGDVAFGVSFVAFGCLVAGAALARVFDLKQGSGNGKNANKK